MQLDRPAFALHPKSFGRGRTYEVPAPVEAQPLSISDDVKLFAMTFIAGFAFVSILIS
jgi:hypothetical protein